MRFRIVLAVAVCVLGSAGTSQADGTHLKFAILPSDGLAIEHGANHPAPPMLTQGLMFVNQHGKFGWSVELDAVMPFTSANPAPQIVPGFIYSVSPKVYLMPFGILRYVPEQQGGHEATSAAGGGLVCGVNVNSEIAVGLYLSSYTYLSGDHKPVYLNAGPKITFVLF